LSFQTEKPRRPYLVFYYGTANTDLNCSGGGANIITYIRGFYAKFYNSDEAALAGYTSLHDDAFAAWVSSDGVCTPKQTDLDLVVVSGGARTFPGGTTLCHLILGTDASKLACA
jgi:hypothetical protein